MLWIPRQAASALEDNVTSAATPGTTIAADASAHTKGSYTQLIASTAYTAYGITVMVSNVATATSTNTRVLVDIAVGAASSESDLIPNLMAGASPPLSAATGIANFYHFPIVIAAGTRLSARCQAVTGSDTVDVSVWLHQYPVPGKWYGSRVTAYGVDTATSSGTSHSGTNGTSYATTTQLTASTTNPVRYLQIGHDLLTDNTGVTQQRLVRIAAGSSTNYVASNLPLGENTSQEAAMNVMANFILSQMMFNIPAASYLGVGVMQNGASEARGYALYGVD